MNRATIIGRLGRDPELRKTQTGESVANLSLATSERWKDKNTGEKREKTEWHKIVLWGALADVAGKYLAKGDQVCIEGKIETRKWADKDGTDRYTTEIRGEKLEMLGGGSEKKAEKPADDYSAGEYRKASGRGTPAAADLDDEIPF